jgi:DNA ligase D-like protein (predicted polymerase)
MKRFVDGVNGEFFFQKRVPKGAPEWLQTATFRFPSGRTATELVVNDGAHLVWAVNLGVVDFNPHPVRRSDLDRPDELRVDLDPMPGVRWNTVRKVALCVREVLGEHGLVGYPKTSGSRGIHVNVRIEPRWDYIEVRRAALALAREVERRLPRNATSKWWKEERHGVFVDYNQNAKDRTVASAYSVRPTADATVSAPLDWKEVPDCEPGDFTLSTMPRRYERLGDRHAGIDTAAGSIDALLELFERQGEGDAPWPPHYTKQAGEPARVQPSKAKLPVIEIGRAKRKEDALAGLERWKERHPDVVPHLEPADVLVDSMRGRSSTWTRIRVNLQHVPAKLRPAQDALDPDEKTLSSS